MRTKTEAVETAQLTGGTARASCFRANDSIFFVTCILKANEAFDTSD